MNRHRGLMRRAGSCGLIISLVAAGAVTLTGCTPDARVTAIDDAIARAGESIPYLVGLQAGDVTEALKEAGEESRVTIPVVVPDLGTANAPVVAQIEEPVVYQSADDAAPALAQIGEKTWLEWFQDNPDGVEYVAGQIPVTITDGADDEVVVKVDQSALEVFAQPFVDANARLFVRTAEATPQWQQAMVFEHFDKVVGEVTGLPEPAQELAKVEGVEPVGDGRFTTTVSFPDPKAVVEYQAEKALESYGTGKIWGGVSKSAFESECDEVSDIPASVGETMSTKVTVQVSARDDGDYSVDDDLASTLERQAERYAIDIEPGSYAAPEGIDEANSAAVDKAMKELDKRTIKEQKKPGTKLLKAGKSGMSVTIKTGDYADRHVTFFKWNSSKQVVSAFIKAGKTLTLRLPAGSYRLVYATGDTWYGPKYSFGPKGSYSEFKTDSGSSGPMKISIKSGYNYTISIGVSGGSGEGSVPSGSTDNPYEQ